MPDLLSTLGLKPSDAKTTSSAGGSALDEPDLASGVFGALLAGIVGPSQPVAADQAEGDQKGYAAPADPDGAAAAPTSKPATPQSPISTPLALGLDAAAPVQDGPGGRPVVADDALRTAAAPDTAQPETVTVLPNSKQLLVLGQLATAADKKVPRPEPGAVQPEPSNPGRPIAGGRPGPWSTAAAPAAEAPGDPGSNPQVWKPATPTAAAPAIAAGEPIATTEAGQTATVAGSPEPTSLNPAAAAPGDRATTSTLPAEPAPPPADQASAPAPTPEYAAPTETGASAQHAAVNGTGSGPDPASQVLNATVRAGAATSTQTATSVNPGPDQIRSQALRFVLDRSGASGRDQTLTLQLEPEHLGKVEVRLIARGQRLEVVFRAENAEAQQALRDGASELARSLGERVESRWHAVDVRVNETGQGRSGPGDPETEDHEETSQRQDRRQNQQQRDRRRERG